MFSQNYISPKTQKLVSWLFGRSMLNLFRGTVMAYIHTSHGKRTTSLKTACLTACRHFHSAKGAKGSRSPAQFDCSKTAISACARIKLDDQWQVYVQRHAMGWNPANRHTEYVPQEFMAYGMFSDAPCTSFEIPVCLCVLIVNRSMCNAVAAKK